MNEKELKAYQSQPDVEHRADTSNYSVLAEDCYRFPAHIRIQADIARQLTRLADQGDDTAKARDHSVEQMMSALAAIPAPDVPTDALVEAVKPFADKQVIEFYNAPTPAPDDHIFHTGLAGGAGKLTVGDLRRLHKALAAHEKAVR